MFKNYFIITLRNIRRHKIFFLINVLGLALGSACTILILLWVRYELSYDGFHQNARSLYRVMVTKPFSGGNIVTYELTPGPLADALEEEVPEITRAVRVSSEREMLFSYGNHVFREKGRYAGNDLLQMFSFPLVSGHADRALAEPNALVISEKLAQKYFGSNDALGKTIRIDNREDFRVTGVMRDIPGNSSLKFDFLMPVEGLVRANEWMKSWNVDNLITYVMLRSEASRSTVDGKIKNFIRKHQPESQADLFLQPYPEVYLHSEFRQGVQQGGRIVYVRLFSVIAVFVLVIACVNYMNLATAWSGKRAKEVGVRKSVGAERQSLFWQFVGESLFITLFSILLSLLLVEAILPAFRALTGASLSVPYEQPGFVLGLLGMGMFTGLLAGGYPALFLSALDPVKVLKGSLQFSNKAVLFRQGMVIFQFTVSTILIIGTLVVYSQVQYFKNKNLGLDRENVLYVALEGELYHKVRAFKHELSAAASIQSVTAASHSPLAVGIMAPDLEWPGKRPDEKISFDVVMADYGFLRTMNIQLKAGRDFSRQFATDSANILINEEAARRMNLPQPVGQRIRFWGRDGVIAGVVKDFHAHSLHSPIEPLLITLRPENTGMLFVRTAPGQTARAIAHLEQCVRKYNPAYPFEYHFLDQDYEHMYKSETVVGTLTNYFTVLAIFISCLGLFGLSLFKAEQRRKEISIRKVMGASGTQVVVMLWADFLKPVLVAFGVAAPVGWYLMTQWLGNFAYHVVVSWQMVAAAGLACLLITLLAVSFQSVRAALQHPVKSLQRE